MFHVKHIHKPFFISPLFATHHYTDTTHYLTHKYAYFSLCPFIPLFTLFTLIVLVTRVYKRHFLKIAQIKAKCAVFGLLGFLPETQPPALILAALNYLRIIYTICIKPPFQP